MSKRKFVCLNCHSEYESYKENSKFCSIICKKEYNNFNYNCDYCNKEMIVPRSKYMQYKNGIHKNIFCSRDCATKFSEKKVVKICEYCGKEYKICNSFKDIQKFCSRDCYNKYKELNAKKYKKICPICKKEYITSYESQIYCSKECTGISQRVRKKCICYKCGKEFERITSEVDKNTRHYCSNQCRIEDITWNEHDLIILRKNYNILPNTEIQKMLSKEWTIEAIRRKAEALGLGVDRTWSDNEKELLINNYSKLYFYEIIKLFPGRTSASIRGMARKLKLYSKFYIENIYTDQENLYLRNNYLSMTNKGLALELNRSEGAIAQRLLILNLYRPKEYKKDGYKDLTAFVRSKLYFWKNDIREYYNYTCQVTGSRTNIVVHHIRSFNLLFSETMELLEFPVFDDFSDYSDDQLDTFVNKFLEIQEYYGEYICITEPIHKQFHDLYGYGNNTIEQWNDYIKNYHIKHN